MPKCEIETCKRETKYLYEIEIPVGNGKKTVIVCESCRDKYTGKPHLGQATEVTEKEPPDKGGLVW